MKPMTRSEKEYLAMCRASLEKELPCPVASTDISREDVSVFTIKPPCWFLVLNGESVKKKLKIIINRSMRVSRLSRKGNKYDL